MTTRKAGVEFSTFRPRRNDFLIPLLMVAADYAAIVGAFTLAYVLRFGEAFSEIFPVTKGYPPASMYLWSSLVIAPVWILIFNTRKIYRARRRVDSSVEFLQIVVMVSFGMLIVMSIAFFYREFEYSRLVFLVIWILGIALIFLGRVLVLGYERFLYRRGRELRNVLIVGSNPIAQNIALWMTQQSVLGYNLVGYVSEAENRIESVETERLGSLHDVTDLVQRHRIETIIVCLETTQVEMIQRIFEGLIGRNVQLLLQSDILGVSATRLRLHEMFGFPFLGVKDIPMSTWNRIAKRMFDIIFSVLVLLLSLPFCAIAALLILIDDGRPVFYRQRRVGLDGREFDLVKFRTMSRDAEEKSGPTWTRRGDERVTHVGRFLRRFSIDELPQFINVLRGDMSIVGPRPERPEFVSQFQQYVPKYLERHRLKTGITGWAQVNGLRGEVPIVERTKYDLYYIENWSMRLDFRIILKTMYAILFGKDAY